MIESLSISNLGVIQRAHVDLGPGLTVVTGETGAGKTMFVTALNLLTGARAETSSIRAGEDRATVEGIFVADEHPEVIDRIADAGGETEDGAVVLSRVVPAKGRARATAGGRTVPAGVLAEVGESLVSMHGQTEQLTLRSAAKQRNLLDRFGGAAVAEAFAAYTAAYREWTELTAKDEQLKASQAERSARIEYLEKALADIENIRPIAGEDERLNALSAKLSAAEDLKTAVQTAHALLLGGEVPDSTAAIDLVNSAHAEVDRAAGADDTLAELAGQLASASIALSDAAGELSRYLDSFAELDEISVEETENRRSELNSLSVYGDTLDAVLEFETAAGTELLELGKDNTDSAEMAELLEKAHAELTQAAAALTAARTTAAAEFAKLVSAELSALSMPKAQISFEITPTDPTSHGADAIQLLFSSHSGVQPGDIGKLASGGELSRVMLAIEVVMADRTSFNTFIFDEVDAGVGGRAAIEIGKRLAALASHSQVIVVTHLAQVAAWADRHLVIAKDDSGAGAVSGVSELDRDGRETELARMLGGISDSDSARAHATELMEIAHTAKSGFADRHDRIDRR